MKRINLFISSKFIITVLFAMLSIHVFAAISDTAPPSMTNENYKYAIMDAQNPEPHEVYNKLLAVKDNNDKIRKRGKGDKLQVRVISIIDENSYNRFYKGKDYKHYSLWPDLWVTVEPELIEKIRNNKNRFNGTDKENRMSIREIYGFPPDKKVDRVVIFWADAKDMFRPSPDKEIDDSKAELNFPSDVDHKHRTYINNIRSRQFFAGKKIYIKDGVIVGEELKDAYPWTQLGYSYDWGSKANNIYNYGLSEFIVKGNKFWGDEHKHSIEIVDIVTIEDYIKNAKEGNNI